MDKIEKSDISFDITSKKCQADGKELLLNGFGIRKVFLVEVYRVFMFSPKPITARDQLQAGEPVRFAIKFSYGPISNDRMKQAWTDAFKKNVSDQEFDAQSEVVGAFLDSIREYQKHDVVVYDICDQHVSVYTNNKHIMTITSEVICKWITDVFIGDKPIDDNVKKGILAGC